MANLAKSRFLATASHDLRQPLHALGLFVAELRARLNALERERIVERIDAAVAAMNELFSALLDISKLDAGVLAPDLKAFPLAHVLGRVETTFAPAAHEKGLRLRIVSSGAWVRSDPILLERILLNLVSNAVRHTAGGGIVVGSRRRAGAIRIEVWDSGAGIPHAEQRNIFGEFYRFAGSGGDAPRGLGLAIVDRLCQLLDHPIELSSQPGKGSRFTILVPLATARSAHVAPSLIPEDIAQSDRIRGKVILVIDDDELARDGMTRLLLSWRCRVIAAESDEEALASLGDDDRRPDLIISDNRLAGGRTGLEAIARLHEAVGAPVPALLISGDTAPERLREADAGGHQFLHKPVAPATLRAALNHLLRQRDRPRQQLHAIS